MNKVTHRIVLDPKSKEDAKRLFLIVTWQRKSRQYSLGIDDKLTKKQFENPRLAVTKEVMDKVMPLLTKAGTIISELGDSFSFDKFKNRWKGLDEQNSSIKADIQSVYEHYVAVKQTLSPSTKDSYKTAADRINNYKRLNVTDWNKEYLQGFVNELSKERKVTVKGVEETKETSSATIKIYLRSLRALYNYASQFFHLDDSIFKDIRIKPTIPIEKVLTPEEFERFNKYAPNTISEQFAKDMFFLTYELYGANFADIIRLKNKNFNGDTLTFYREKSQYRMSIPLPIEMILKPKAFELINKYGLLDPSCPNDFVFPFINDDKDPRLVLTKTKNLTRRVNKGLNIIGKKLDISNLTSMVARHTVVTNLINKGVTVFEISRILGHTSITTTQNYIGKLNKTNLIRISNLRDSSIGSTIEDEVMQKFGSQI